MVLQVVEYRTPDELSSAPRVVYRVRENEAAFSTGPVTLAGEAGELHALVFELVERASPAALRHAAVRLDEPEGHVLRCDRVDFPPGGVAYLHTHQGPGIRVLLHGRIRIETEGTATEHRPLQAWFERGPEPVFAAASETEPTAFVRCMVLPRRLLGQSSIRYVRSGDAEKPKSQHYTVFVDEPVEP